MGLLKLSEGKIIYQSWDPREVILLFKDDITAFDGAKHAKIPGKEEINAAMSEILFDEL